MKAVFRTDASLNIGTGHVMRCLTLADALRLKGVECHFICREHSGNLINRIRSRGYQAHLLPLSRVSDLDPDKTDITTSAHSHWLGVSQEQDAQDCTHILQHVRPDWLIVDHYALDVQWETYLRTCCDKILVIDDLADRVHDCDLLLDQTFGRRDKDYLSLVPRNCVSLCGSRYAILRPEFALWRPYSLARRKIPRLRRLLITMGGVDQANVGGQILDALHKGRLPDKYHVSIVLGETSPWINEIEEQVRRLPWQTDVLVGVRNMASLMADSDLIIGAAGTTSWERCCLGVPTLLMVLADNQQVVAENLRRAGAVQIITQGQWNDLSTIVEHLSELSNCPSMMSAMSRSAARVVDGNGVARIICALSKINHDAI